MICTIHQPQSKLFALFDNLILLKAGEIVYQGPAGKAITFFAKAGFPCPPLTNPADHLMDVITPGLGEDAQASKAKGETLKKYFKPTAVDLDYGSDKPLMPLRDMIPWHKQFLILLRRSLQEHRRKWTQAATQIMNSIVVSILIGLVFYRLGNGQGSVEKRQAVLFFCVINQGIFASLETINSFPSERALALRERAAGTYNVSAYFMAKTVADTVFQLLPPIVFSAIVYHVGREAGRQGGREGGREGEREGREKMQIGEMQIGRYMYWSNDIFSHVFLPPSLPLTVGGLAGYSGEVLGVYVLHGFVPVECDVACDDGELLGADHGYERDYLAFVF